MDFAATFVLALAFIAGALVVAGACVFGVVYCCFVVADHQKQKQIEKNWRKP